MEEKVERGRESIRREGKRGALLSTEINQSALLPAAVLSFLSTE